MHYIRLVLRLIFTCCLASYALITHTTVAHKDVHLPEYLWQRQLNDSQVALYASKQKINPEAGQLVIHRAQDGAWVFGTVVKQLPDEYYDIATPDNSVVHKHVALHSIKTLSSVWNQLFNPTINLETMRKLLDERADYYKTHGAPDGHGMILPANSKIAVIGDLHGKFESLQSHLGWLCSAGLLDAQFHLKPNCYVFGLGDYAGEGGQGVLILSTLLKLQEYNPDQVFLLHGDHEDAAKAQIDGFQKEWYGTFGDTKKEFCLAELVWLKLLMVWKSLPKVLLVGLQMPSTQHYDFLMFCHASFDFEWRPDAFMSKIIEKHINQCYKNPCIIDYRDGTCKDDSFSTGIFADDDDIAKIRAKQAGSSDQKTIWSKSAFTEFIHRHASRIDKNRMYEYCLCAIIRGHEQIPGGLVALKKNGLNAWKALKDNKIYEIEPCSIYTCISGYGSLSKVGCFDGAFGLIEAGSNGHWFITSHLEQ